MELISAMSMGDMKMMYSDEFLLAELRRFYDENGRSPHIRDMNGADGYPSAPTYRSRFGSFNQAITLVGLTANTVHSTVYSDEFLLEELQRFFRENGRSPHGIDMNTSNGYPSMGTYVHRFGSVNNAISSAGLIVNSGYSDEFMLAELRRFCDENGRSPRQKNMNGVNGFPGSRTYISRFGSFNRALELAGLTVNQYKYELFGNEVCSNCGISHESAWTYKDGVRLCKSCARSDYRHGELDPASAAGFGFIGQRVAAKALDIGMNHDCNCSGGFGAAYDLYDEEGYGEIDVKASTLKSYNNRWRFGLKNKHTPDYYICIGFSHDKSDVEHVWIISSSDDRIDNISSLCVHDTQLSLSRMKKYEVDARPYNYSYHSMSIDNCSVMSKTE